MKKKFKKMGVTLMVIFGLSTAVYAECMYNGSVYEEGSILPHTNIPSRFFVCSNGWWIELQCPEGLVYNPIIQTCDYPWNVPSPGSE